MTNLTITIVPDTSTEIDENGEEQEQDGFQYQIYDCEADSLDFANSLDGGFCSGSLLDTLDMATIQAKEVIKQVENLEIKMQNT